MLSLLTTQPRSSSFWAPRCGSARSSTRQTLIVRAAEGHGSGHGASRGPPDSSSSGGGSPGASAPQASPGIKEHTPNLLYGGAVELPGGALWWQHLHASSSTTPTYGTNFVLQRPTVGGPGLVKASRPPMPMRRAASPAPLPPVVWAAPGGSAGLGLMLAGSSLGNHTVVVDTDFVLLPPRPSIAPNTTCFGLVWQPSEGQEQGQQAAAQLPEQRRGRRRGSTRHPRRTQMLRFTCNLCGEVNEGVEVNPHAWAKGSVFARCQGCTAVHKLRDNLRIFHELSGPIFPPRELRSTYLVQEILDRIQDNNNNRN